jgi:hypothetical protein
VPAELVRLLDESELRRALAAASNIVTGELAISDPELAHSSATHARRVFCLGRLPLKLVVEDCVRRLATPDEKNEILVSHLTDSVRRNWEFRKPLLNIMLIIGALEGSRSTPARSRVSRDSEHVV